MKSEFPSAVPEIPVRDINDAVLYYQESLGFTLDWGSQELGLAALCGRLVTSDRRDSDRRSVEPP
jgi:hypothetical protein